MPHVFEGVVELVAAEGSARPVGVSLTAPHHPAQHRTGQISIAGGIAVSQETGRHLGVEHPCGEASGLAGEEVEVASTRRGPPPRPPPAPPPAGAPRGARGAAGGGGRGGGAPRGFPTIPTPSPARPD